MGNEIVWSTIEFKINNSADLTESEAKWLLERSDPRDLAYICDLADQVNRRLNGNVVSFVHNMNVNYTNICEYRCTFCEFKKSPDSKNAYILTFDDVKHRLEHADGKVSEITYQGGLSPEVKFDQALDLLHDIKTAYPHIHAHAFSPEEIDYYASENDLTWRETIRECQKAGMDSMCGTAAEVLDDEIRKKICWEKISSDEWVEIVKTGHELGMHSTATILFGHLEKPEHVMNHFQRVRALQRETRGTRSTGSGCPERESKGITEFIPLLFMPDKTKLGRAIDKNLHRIEYGFKMMAVARLYFMNDIRNIQVSWVKMGWDNALKALDRGANDMGGTLYYENITREAGGQNGEYTPVSKFISEISRVGKTPLERDTVYSFQQPSVITK